MKQSTLEAQKIQALETYKNAKKRYLETLSQSDWNLTEGMLLWRV